MCTTCHNSAEWPALYVVDEVTFNSGAVLTFGEGEASNLCMLCHQGNSSTPTVDEALADLPDDTVDENIRFSNIHYFAAGATLFGSEAQGAYQFAGEEYVGPNTAHPLNKCADCHNVHALEVQTEACTACHASAPDPSDPRTYRIDQTDYDGDGDVAEGIAAEIDSFGERLYAAIQAYAEAQGNPITYLGSYPYWGDAEGNRYAAFTPNLMRAAYNYQYYQKDPGAFTHNPKYVLQVLYDSIEAVDGDTSGFTRP
jgi:Zn finger protein HypA/HybF involved in hydrogenase expression